METTRFIFAPPLRVTRPIATPPAATIVYYIHTLICIASWPADTREHLWCFFHSMTKVQPPSPSHQDIAGQMRTTVHRL
ncbi:unnamed protein product [Ectocarpus fasciculatus]